MKEIKEGVYVGIYESSSVEGDRVIYQPINGCYINTPEEAHKYVMCKINQANSKAESPTKKYAFELYIMKEGDLLGSVVLPSYFIYEDFIGGRSIWNKKFQIKEVVDVNVDDDKIMIIYIDGDGERRSIEVSK